MANANTPEKRWADLGVAAQYSPFTKRHLYNLIRSGTLAAYKLSPGGKLVVDLRALDSLIESHRHNPRTRVDDVVDAVVAELREEVRT